MSKRLLVSLSLVAAGLIAAPQLARAQEHSYSHIRIVRLSFVEGDVQYRRPKGDWQDARTNLPIEDGFAIRTAEGYAEVEFEDATWIRLATHSTVEFTELALLDGNRISRVAVPEGTAIISTKLKRGEVLSVKAADFTINVPKDGRFRIDASPESNWVSVFNGKVEVSPDSGSPATVLSAHHSIHEDAAGGSAPEMAKNPPDDEFDKWVSHREESLNQATNETASLLNANAYTTGFADLYNYGIWSDIPGFGMGWVPYGMGAGWMPYTNGGWSYMGLAGWNWVSAEPWGWVPYHFGSWVNAPGLGWAWLPVGASSWVPANATWVRVNNQMAWVPNAPPLGSKPSKTQLAAVPSTAILASQGAGGVIGAGSQVHLSQAGVTVQKVDGPPAGFASAHAAATAPSFTPFSNGSIARAGGTPTAVHAPTSNPMAHSGPMMRSAPNVRSAPVIRTAALPRTVTAPHSMPVPAIARGAASTAVFRGAPMGGGHAAGPAMGPSVGMSAPPASAGAAHASAGAASSGGHH